MYKYVQKYEGQPYEHLVEVSEMGAKIVVCINP